MSCRYIYQGKQYEAWELAELLKSLPLSVLRQGIEKLVHTDTAPSNSSNTYRKTVTLPQAIIADTLGTLAQHTDYQAAKAGDTDAAMRLAADMVTPELLAKLQGVQADAVLGVMVDEEGGTNAIPTATAAHMAKGLGLRLAGGVHKSAGSKRTQQLGLDRIFSRPTFEGTVPPGTRLIVVDDTLTQGGTIAALAEHLHNQGAEVVAVVALTGKSYSSRLAPSNTTLAQLRAKLDDAEDQFQQTTGRRFDELTESEARYLANYKPQSAIRERLNQAARSGLAAPDGSAVGREDAVTTPAANAADEAIRMSLPGLNGAPAWNAPSASG